MELNVTLLERLAQKTENLQLLTIRDMNRTSEQVRDALVRMSVQILRNPSLPITSLWLSRLGSSHEGDQLLEAICSSNISSLKYLNLGDNKSWWLQDSTAHAFAQFLARQHQLEELHLQKNDFSSAILSLILAAVKNSECLVSLKKLQLDESCWDAQESCEHLAFIIAEAGQLEMVRIVN